MNDVNAAKIADELDLIETIRYAGEDATKQFLIYARQLLQALGVNDDDQRLSFTTTANRRFAFTIGQRYCLAYVPEEQFPWHFISTESLPTTPERSESSYSGAPKAFYERCLRSDDIRTHFEGIVKAARAELERSSKSGFSKHSNPTLANAVADPMAENEIMSRAKVKPGDVSGKIWKLGSTWGTGAPSFYSFIQKEQLVLADAKRKYDIGDLIMITDGYEVKAITLVTGNLGALKELPKFHTDAVSNGLPLDYDLLMYTAEWYELPKELTFLYKHRQGKALVKDPVIQDKVKTYWANRSVNYWLFQGNAEQYDFIESLRNNALNSWVVKAHQDKINAGDKVIVWITGKGGGCVALGEITAAPSDITETDKDYWKTQPLEGLRAGLRINHDFSQNPIGKEEIVNIDALKNLNAGNQGTNFRSNYNEYQALLNLRTKTNSIKPIMHHLALNTIYFGPPGTGKTYKMQGLMKEYFIDQNVSRSPQEVLTEKLQPYPLWKVLAAALSQFQQPVSVAELHETTLVMAKLNPDIKVPRNSMWRTLQSYADEQSSGIDAKYKASLQLFSKDKKSRWSLMESKKHELEDIIEPELLALAKEPLIVTNHEQQTLTKRYRFITFHQKYSYEDFIEGIKPVLQEGEEDATGLQFVLKKGLFYEACLQALRLAGYTSFESCYEDSVENRKQRFRTAVADPMKHFALFIDEINRANISAVFGELITLLEDDKRAGGDNEMWVTLPTSNDRFCVPANLFVIGTMNTADRSIALLDIALRRRFHFEGLYPQYPVKGAWWSDLLEDLNEAIYKAKKNADLFIGHAFFIKKREDERATILNKKIIPLLNEYCQNNQSQVQTILKGANIEFDEPALSNNYQLVAK